MKEVALKWVDSQMMVGIDSAGNALVMGFMKDREPAWNGMKPSDLLLLSLASCTGYDVIMILTKQKEPMSGFEIKVTAENMEEAPYAFTKINVHYIIEGAVSEKKVQRAIHLSEDKYCSVSNTLKHGVELTNSYEIVEKK